MVRVCLFTFLFLFNCIAANGQISPDGIRLNGVNEKKGSNMWKKLAYNATKSKYSFTIFLTDGRKIIANSSIFKDPGSGRHFVYYTEDDSVQRIFPEQTSLIVRSDPYHEDKKIEGFPADGHWRFKLVTGYISAWSFLFAGIEPDEYQIENGETLPVASKGFAELMKKYPKSRDAFLDKHYYKAIRLFNKRK